MIFTKDQREYLLERIERTDGCWYWDGPVVRRHGYGQANLGGCRTSAHRAVYQLLVGPIPPGLTIDHLCHTRACPGGITCPHRRCVNPAHLALATSWENTKRGHATSAKNVDKTHCPKGHAYSHVDPRGWRKCGTCIRESDARRRALRRTGPRTHCKRGHEFTEANTYRPPSIPNRRECRTCRETWARTRPSRAKILAAVAQ